jgi:hypothetical protein
MSTFQLTRRNKMKEHELDTIIRLIPYATVRQIEVIMGQIDIHLTMIEMKKDKLKEKDRKMDSKYSI